MHAIASEVRIHRQPFRVIRLDTDDSVAAPTERVGNLIAGFVDYPFGQIVRELRPLRRSTGDYPIDHLDLDGHVVHG